MQFKALYYARAAGAVLDSIMSNGCTRSPLTAEIKNIWLGQPTSKQLPVLIPAAHIEAT